MKKRISSFWPLLIAVMIMGILTYSLYPEPPIKKADRYQKQFGKTLIGIQYLDARDKLHSTYVDWGPDGNLDVVEKCKVYGGVRTKEIIVFTDSETEAERLNSEATELNPHGNLIPKDPNKRYVWGDSPEGQTWQEKFEKLLEDYNKQ